MLGRVGGGGRVAGNGGGGSTRGEDSPRGIEIRGPEGAARCLALRLASFSIFLGGSDCCDLYMRVERLACNSARPIRPSSLECEGLPSTRLKAVHRHCIHRDPPPPHRGLPTMTRFTAFWPRTHRFA